MTVIAGSGKGEKTQQSRKRSGLFIELAFGVRSRFNVGDQTFVFVNCDYMFAEPQYRNVEIISTLSGISSMKTITQKMQSVNLGLGVGYSLWMGVSH